MHLHSNKITQRRCRAIYRVISVLLPPVEMSKCLLSRHLLVFRFLSLSVSAGHSSHRAQEADLDGKKINGRTLCSLQRKPVQCAFVVDGGTQDSIEQDSNFKFQDHSHSIHWSKKLSAKGKKKKNRHSHSGRALVGPPLSATRSGSECVQHDVWQGQRR